MRVEKASACGGVETARSTNTTPHFNLRYSTLPYQNRTRLTTVEPAVTKPTFAHIRRATLPASLHGRHRSCDSRTSALSVFFFPNVAAFVSVGGEVGGGESQPTLVQTTRVHDPPRARAVPIRLVVVGSMLARCLLVRRCPRVVRIRRSCRRRCPPSVRLGAAETEQRGGAGRTSR